MSEPTPRTVDIRPGWLVSSQVKDNPVRQLVVGGTPYEDTVVRKGMEPRLPYVVGFDSKKGIPPFIDESVLEVDRKYILGHEIREQTTLQERPEIDRCIESLKTELTEVEADRPEELRAYAESRSHFFDALVELYKDPQQRATKSAEFLQGLDRSQEYLHGFINEWKDQIPEGTFHADYTPEQAAAIRRAREIGARLAATTPQLATDYEDPTRSNLDLARIYIPEDAEEFPQVAAKAIGYAIRRLLPPDKLAELTRLHRKHLLEQQTGESGSEARTQHNRGAAIARHEQGIPVDAAAMTRGRGLTPWTVDEATIAIELSEDPQYRNGDRVDWKNIAEVINASFHEESPRTGKSVYDVVRDHRRGIKRGT